MIDYKIYIKKINKNNIDLIIKNILPHEQKCINLTSLLKKQKIFFIENKNELAFLDSIIVLDKDDNFLGVIIISLNKVVLHCFLNSIFDNEKILENIKLFLSSYFIKTDIPNSVMGEERFSCLIEDAIFNAYNIKPQNMQSYKLLVLINCCNKNFYSEVFKNLKNKLNNLTYEMMKIVVPTINDLEKIIPLEIDYQNTEVLTDNQKASFEFCKKVVTKYVIKKQILIFKLNNLIISKATINANGFFWNQIGGVYTSPKFRNNGIATAIVQAMVNSKKNKKFALFVKTTNLPAQKMYSKIGFKEYCNFTISYY